MRLVAFDTETTGLWAHGTTKPDGTIGTDQIIQYTMQVWDDGVRAPAQTVYLNPTVPVSEEVRKINGYNEAEWAQRATRAADWHEPANWALLHGAIVLGSNPEFDLRFVDATCRALGVAGPQPSHRRVNLNSLGMPLVALGSVKSAGLGHLAKFFGVDTTGQHRSDVDVRIALDVWEKFLEIFLDRMP